jgi:hypothetical protein
VPNGDIRYLQVKNFDISQGTFSLPKPSIEFNYKTVKHLLLKNDILFAAKGTSNFCTQFQGEKETGMAIASSSFLVIRAIDLNMIYPDYLCWVLNREDTLTFFRTKAAGSAMPSISKALVEAYEITIPPLEIQKKVVELSRLQQQEQRLWNQITGLRNQITQQQLINITQQYGE